MSTVPQSMYRSMRSWWNYHIQPKPLNDPQPILAYPVFKDVDSRLISRSRAYNILNRFTLACLASKRLIEITYLLFPVEHVARRELEQDGWVPRSYNSSSGLLKAKIHTNRFLIFHPRRIQQIYNIF